jgi:hypothetical protein
VAAYGLTVSGSPGLEVTQTTTQPHKHTANSIHCMLSQSTTDSLSEYIYAQPTTDSLRQSPGLQWLLKLLRDPSPHLAGVTPSPQPNVDVHQGILVHAVHAVGMCGAVSGRFPQPRVYLGYPLSSRTNVRVAGRPSETNTVCRS